MGGVHGYGVQRHRVLPSPVCAHVCACVAQSMRMSEVSVTCLAREEVQVS